MFDVHPFSDRSRELDLATHLMGCSAQAVVEGSVPPLPSSAPKGYFTRHLPAVFAECTEQLAAVSKEGVVVHGVVESVWKGSTLEAKVSVCLKLRGRRPQVDYPFVHVIAKMNHPWFPHGKIVLLENVVGSHFIVSVLADDVEGLDGASYLVGTRASLLLMGSILPSERMVDACNRCAMDEALLGTLTSGKRAHSAEVLTTADTTYAASLNAEQNKAIHLMRTPDNVLCVEGPPGTGKTTTVVEMIHQTEPSRRKKTLVMGPSNKSVHTDAERFLQKYGAKHRLAMVGVVDKIPESLHCISVEKVAELVKTWVRDARQAVHTECWGWMRDLCTQYNKDILPTLLRMIPSMYTTRRCVPSSRWGYLPERADPQAPRPHVISLLENTSTFLANVDVEGRCIADCSILFSTLISSGRGIVRKHLLIEDDTSTHAHTLIIDEAGQALVPEALVALSLLPRKLVVVGDVHQLQPCVVSPAAVELGFEESFMQSVLDTSGCRTMMLAEQYRMHKDIQCFPSRMFYGGRLRTGACVEESTWQYPAGAPAYLRPYVFVDVQGEESSPGGRNSTSLCNKAEVAAVCRVLGELKTLQAGGWRCSVGVITMYKSQARLIMDRAAQLRLPDVRVSTVDSFQGDECDVILISMVRCNKGARVGFLNDARRMNVALTRAKHSLIVFGSADTLGRSSCSHCSELVSDAKARGVVIDELPPTPLHTLLSSSELYDILSASLSFCGGGSSFSSLLPPTPSPSVLGGGVPLFPTAVSPPTPSPSCAATPSPPPDVAAQEAIPKKAAVKKAPQRACRSGSRKKIIAKKALASPECEEAKKHTSRSESRKKIMKIWKKFIAKKALASPKHEEAEKRTYRSGSRKEIIKIAKKLIAKKALSLPEREEAQQSTCTSRKRKRESHSAPRKRRKQ